MMRWDHRASRHRRSAWVARISSRTADDYLRFARMLLANGEVDGVRVLSDESVRLMRGDRLTDEQKRHTFLGMPFWIGRGFGLNLSVVTDPAKSRQLFGPGGIGTFGWPGAYGTWWQADPSENLILIYLIQNLPNFGADAAAAVAGNTSLLKTSVHSTEVRPPDVSGTGDLGVAQPTVLISGAGIAGPALAFWLNKSGYRVTIVELSDGIRPGGQTVDLRGAGGEVVERMGLIDKMRARSLDQRGVAWIKPDGHRRAEMPVTAFNGNGLVSKLEILRGDLVNVLYQATNDQTDYPASTPASRLSIRARTRSRQR